MPTVTLKGNPVKIKGSIPAAGTKAKDFTFVKPDLSEATLFNLGNVVKIILAVPSLDTGICALETRQFNQKLSNKTGVAAVVVSKDLPFAMRRFCETEGIANVTAGSDFRYNTFSQEYNTEMMEGGMKGLSARAVFVLDKDNTIAYSELVPEIAQEPDYDKVMEAVEKLL
jgi:thiol peroxidase